MDFDVIVVGGSFSGMFCAHFLAKQGLKVCLFEKKKSIGTSTKSTGIFTKSVMKDLDVPNDLIETEIDGFYLYSPKMKEYEFHFGKPLFFQSDTLEFLRWFRKELEKDGVTIKEGMQCNDFKFTEDGAMCNSYTTNLIVFATGQPRIVHASPTYYAGLEYIVEGVKLKDENMWQAYFDYEIAPGYFSWIVKGKDKLAHIGVLRKVDGSGNPVHSMKMFIDKLGLKIKIKEVRSGAVPLSGPIAKTYGNRFIIAGDAAGQIGAFSSAGINYAAKIGKIAGEVIPNLIDDPTEDNLSNYEKAWKEKLGKFLSTELKIRKMFDNMNSNRKYEMMLNLFDVIPKTNIAKFFERFSNFEPLTIGLPNLLKIHPSF